MFGRRNTDHSPVTPSPSQEQPIHFDILADFPSRAEPQPEPASTVPTPPAEPVPNELPEPTPFVPSQPPTTTDLPTFAPAAARTRPAESVIGPDDFFDGNYRSERGVRIQGTARGSIESRQYIYVEEGAQVEANLAAEDITVSGSFNGLIECRRRLEITNGGRIQGRVQTATLIVHEGGVLDGELHMNRNEQAPTVQEQPSF